jgi:hypothetical protein
MSSCSVAGCKDVDARHIQREDALRHREEQLVHRSSTSEGGSDEAIDSFLLAGWIASQSLSSGGALRRPVGSQ